MTQRSLIWLSPIGVAALLAACIGRIEELPTSRGAVSDGAAGAGGITARAGAGGAEPSPETGGSDGTGCTSATVGGGVYGGIPTDPDELLGYLQAGSYQSFTGYSQVITSSDHGNIKVFINPLLEDSLAAGNEVHPEGAGAIRENYDSGGTFVVGWSVSVKTQADSADGEGWYWYEIDTMISTEPSHACHGVRSCMSCHRRDSVDLVLVSYPLP